MYISGLYAIYLHAVSRLFPNILLDLLVDKQIQISTGLPQAIYLKKPFAFQVIIRV